MIPRRSVVTGGVFGSLLSASGASEAATAGPSAAGADVTDETLARIATAVQALRNDLERQRLFSEIAPIRDVQKTYLRANGRFPDYIDVGVDIWFSVHDWHVRWQQPLSLGRDNSGRYTMLLNGTLLVLHAESLPGYVGPPYEGRQ